MKRIVILVTALIFLNACTTKKPRRTQAAVLAPITVIDALGRHVNPPSALQRTDVVASLKADPTCQQLRAVQANKLYAFPIDIYSGDLPDTCWILGLTWLADRLYPEQFPNLDITSAAQTFYQTRDGWDNAFFEENIHPTFKGGLS